MTTTPRAMILAAGLGSRLGPLSDLRPKPMLPVCGTSLVRWSVLWLRHHGIREIVINLHHLGEQIEADLGDGTALGIAIAYSREHEQLLGTGGGLRLARSLLDDGHGTPIVVVNGKLVTNIDLHRIVSRHRQGAAATMVLRADPDAERWGRLRVDPSSRIVELLGQSRAALPDAGPSSAPLMFTGIHVLQPEVLDRVPPGVQCIVRTAYRSLFDEGDGLFGEQASATEYWWEHSTPERYLQGVCNLLGGTVSLPFAERPLSGIDASARVHGAAEIHEPVWIGPRAHIEANARIGPHVQVGAGVHVDRGVALERCVVWDDVDVHHDVKDEVLGVPTAARGSL